MALCSGMGMRSEREGKKKSGRLSGQARKVVKVIQPLPDH